MKHLLTLALFFWFRVATAADLYIRDESADSNGAYLVAEIEVAPVFLVERFGAPGDGDGIRMSGYYTFRDGNGVVFTIHDYKSTTLWAEDEDLPTPEAFWRQQQAVELSIGAKGQNPTRFKQWVLSEYQAWLKKQR